MKAIIVIAMVLTAVLIDMFKPMPAPYQNDKTGWVPGPWTTNPQIKVWDEEEGRTVRKRR